MAKGDIEGAIIYRDRATAALDKAASSADRTGKKFGGLKKFAAGAGAAAGLLAVKFGQDSVAAFKDAEQSSAALDAALKKFPKTSDVTRASLDKLNLAMSKKTVFDDDAFASGQAVLAQFNLTGKQIEDLTPLLADYATKTGKDLPTSATMLGKAMMGNTKALKALGINYKATGNAAADQAAVTELLRAKIGGAAEAMGNTAAGKAAILNNQYGNLQEKVGAKLVPALNRLADVGLKVVDFMDRNGRVLKPLLIGVGAFVAAIWAVNTAARAYTATQAALNVVMALNPIGLVVIAIAALVAGLVITYKKSETFRNIVQGAMAGARAAIGWVIDKGQALVGFFMALPDRISAVSRGMWNGIKDAFRSALNWIIDKWNGLEFSVPGVSAFGHTLGGFTLGVPDIPRLAKGGVVPARPGGTLALLGEGGRDEAVIPLGRGGRGTGDVFNITINGATDPLATAREVEQALARLQRQRGTRLAFQ